MEKSVAYQGVALFISGTSRAPMPAPRTSPRRLKAARATPARNVQAEARARRNALRKPRAPDPPEVPTPKPPGLILRPKYQAVNALFIFGRLPARLCGIQVA